MQFLNQTPEDKLTDSQGRPYFLWDCNLTRSEFEQRLLKSENPEVRAYFAAKLLRQAKPDDVFLFLSEQDIADLWAPMERYLGNQKPFWGWFLNIREGQGRVKR